MHKTERTEDKESAQLERELKKAHDAIEHTPRRATAIVLAVINSSQCQSVGAKVTICNWLVSLVGQQKLERNLDEFTELLSWLETLVQYDNAKPCALSAVMALVKEQPQLSDKALLLFHAKHTGILQHLRQSADGGTLTEDLLFTTLQCLDVIATGVSGVAEKSEEQMSVLQDAGLLLIHLHYVARPSLKDSVSTATFLISTLALLAKISALCVHFPQTHASELFGLAKSFMTVGLEVNACTNGPALPQKVLPSQHAAYTDEEEDATPENSRAQSRTHGGKVSKTRKPRVGRNKPIDEVQKVTADIVPCAMFDLKTSDSDVSESEAPGPGAGNRSGGAPERHRHSKIRLLCVNLLGVTASALDRRTLYGYWNALFAGGGVDHMDPPPLLLNVALRDPALRCRSASLQVVSQLLYVLRGLLKQAESPNAKRKSIAFLTFSQNLALTIAAMYRTLNTILTTESSLPVLTQALKCLGVLVQATPFHKLDTGIIASFTPHVRALVHHRDYTIQVSALMVMEYLITKPDFTAETASAIGVSVPKVPNVASHQRATESADAIESIALLAEEYCESDAEEEELAERGANVQIITDAANNLQLAGNDSHEASANDGNSSWLLLRVLYNLEPDRDERRFVRTLPSSVRIESLQILTTMAKHIAILLPCLPHVAQSLRAALLDGSVDVRVYAARCLDTSAYEIAGYLQAAKRSATHIESCTSFWQQMLPEIMEHISAPNDSFVVQKVSLCDALSNIGAVVYERLARGVQMQLLSFLSAISNSAGNDVNNEDVAVSSAAVRAMAVFALYPSLRQDMVFLEHTAESILRLMGDANVLVRIKAVWALGNVTDALIASDSEERFSNTLLCRLTRAALKASSDNDKVRCNAVRALGNLLRLILHSLDDDNNDTRELFSAGINKLSECICAVTGGAKVKWNACYAIGNLLRNEALFGNIATMKTWQQPLYSALCHVIVRHANFKVRINAAAAIANIARREHFGSYFERFWSALLAGIEQSVQLDNFSEYNHRDKLQEQLCLTTCHLIGCAQMEDLVGMTRHLSPRVEIVHNTWVRVVNRLVPEQAATLLACAVKLSEQFKHQQQLTIEQKGALVFIANAFSCQ